MLVAWEKLIDNIYSKVLKYVLFLILKIKR